MLEPPAGTYLDGRLVNLATCPVEVDVLERLPTPWGLIRGGVAPDHPEKKAITRVFDEVVRRPGFRFFGNVEVGRDVLPQELSAWYDAVIYAVGAAGDTHMGIEGEDLPGCYSAREFVAWYNGHPDHSDLDIDLSVERAVVIGNGNVAMDVARILTTPIDVLERTDIADYALAALRASRVREVIVLGRRGHLHGAFNNPELEELGELPGVDIVVEGEDLPGDGEVVLDDADAATLRKVDTLRRYAHRPIVGHPRRIVLRFLTSPVELLGHDRVEGLLASRNHLEHDPATGRLRARPTGEEAVIDAGLVLRAIGYFGTPIAGLPFDDHKGVIPSADGRVLDHGTPVPGTYVTGWVKRGPNGIIGTNKKCARDTVRSFWADAHAGRLPRADTVDAPTVREIVKQRQPALVEYDGWKAIDHHERQSGQVLGRPRIKLTNTTDLVAQARCHQ
ncbi:NADP oxidoreductase [Haloechinothrix aidingensis]|uniref:NADP oxidoreductase n=1 Tax=Haloechinothrix aidingensis TaxID=2752311 RepID=UPI001FE5F916|nr:NADP oxidoreductase [Haloechinothrix aidingensis]